MSALVQHGADAFVAERPANLARLRTFHTLDALRFVAAVVILLFHADFLFGVGMPAEGQIAVDLFFCMSGFIIAHRYDSDLREGMGAARFFAVRLVRLYPLYLLGTLLGVLPSIAMLIAGEPSALHLQRLASLPAALLMLPSHLALPATPVLYPLNFVAWTLTLEIVINTLYAASFRFWTLERIVVAVSLGLVALVATATTFGSLHVGFAWPHARGGVARVLFGFSAGVLIARLHRGGIVAPRLPWWLPIVATLLLLCLPPIGDRAVWELAACALAVPAIVAVAVATEPPRALRGSCAIGGLSSYLLYSLHAPLVGLFLRGEALLHLDLDRQTPAEGCAFALLLVALCVGAHLFYDKPVRRLFSSKLALAATRPRRDVVKAGAACGLPPLAPGAKL